MTYASLRWTEPHGPKLRFGRTLAGLACGVAIPSFLAAILSAVSAVSEGDNIFEMIVAGTAYFALFGLVSILLLFLPMILYFLRRARNPLAMCVFIGAVSGPGPLGYLVLIYALPTSLMMFMMGAMGGFIFWVIAVRGLPMRTDLPG